MRELFPASPGREELRSLEIHELIRDFPELFSLLQLSGVDPARNACVSLKETRAGEDPIIGEVEGALDWRKGDGK